MTRLMDIRKERGLTRADLSVLTGIPIRSLEGLEQGLRQISGASLDTVCTLAEALQVHPADLVDDPKARALVSRACMAPRKIV